jgi:hypothetical protein
VGRDGIPPFVHANGSRGNFHRVRTNATFSGCGCISLAASTSVLSSVNAFDVCNYLQINGHVKAWIAALHGFLKIETRSPNPRELMTHSRGLAKISGQKQWLLLGL